MAGKPTHEKLEQRVKELENKVFERKRLDAALRESEERLRTITDTALDSIFCKDINRRYTFVNPSMIQLLGCTKADLIGKVPEEVFGKEDAAIVTEVDERTLNGENISEVRSLSIAGKPFTFHTIQVPLRDSDGNITGISGIVRDITDFVQAQEALLRAHDELERRVEERTADLASVNKNLEEEISQRKHAWEKLKQKEKELRIKTTELKETNIALSILLKKGQMDKEEVEHKVVSNVKALIEPYLKKLKKTNLTPDQGLYLKILQSNLGDILSPFLRNLAMKYSGLTPKEIEVVSLVKEGKNTKEIAALLNTTKRAVESHRHSLRVKLGLNNRKANLRSYLLSIP